MAVPPYLPLPPMDRHISPRTGWTRAHWEAVADRLLAGVLPYASPRLAQYRLPGRTGCAGVHADGLEGYARTFLLAAFRIASAQGSVPGLVERYATGLDAGTDPASGEAWPRMGDMTQQLVEAASIVIGLHETRPWLWDQLDDKVRENTVAWLSDFRGKRVPDNNWRLFKVVTEQFLASVGAPHDQEAIDEGLDRLDDWYRGNGWYTDGPGRHFDYYNGWALHLYPLFWARIAGDGAHPDRTRVHRERLSDLLSAYPYFFGADGAPVHQGRSLTYRFAAVAPVWAGALAGATPLEPGLTRRIASGALRHFVERGVPDERGLLSLGWYEPFLPVTQPYSGPASSYWASKGFLGLLLPADHPVWTATERMLPVEESDTRLVLPEPGWLLHGTRDDGIVRLLNHGSDYNHPEPVPQVDDPHYSKLAYSTRTAPDAAAGAWTRALDNHFAVIGADGRPTRRRRIEPVRVTEHAATSRYSAPIAAPRAHGSDTDVRGGEVTVETTSFAHGSWEVRVHRVELTGVAPGAAVGVREGGYSVANPASPAAEAGSDTVESGVDTPGNGAATPRGDLGSVGSVPWAEARTVDGLHSVVIGLHGWRRAEVAHQVGANAFGPCSAVPVLYSDVDPQESGVFVTLVVLSGDAAHPGALAGSCRTEVATDGTVTVRLPDGTLFTA
ncbi:DUF2264 domain-containing protein [Streptomyces sp. H39-S7]|uniref:DUF2264 domain-containing protein n=1 Tax=Streptomyces sp. H39-S7 TaxID=3004357 RepID=UPI0022B01B1A|nr:DUF2264 domain-containing protein [Streptomyces sp. H39-S7]MCZ4125519.1 DUF2264 domain-containing protein [Streptomyces sp. H39-S7]